MYFDYPRSYESAGTLDTIKLEIGPMAAWSPSEEAAITPYAADVVPFGPELSTTVRTASPERTFWEKATILHQEANRPEGKAMPRRYSRHYYDMYRLGHSFVLGRAVAQPDLLEQVVRFKEKFYRTPWAKLADARPGTLRLAPPKGRLDELAADYASMRLFSLIDLRARVPSTSSGSSWSACARDSSSWSKPLASLPASLTASISSMRSIFSS